jgi:hypothetical protein
VAETAQNVRGRPGTIVVPVCVTSIAISTQGRWAAGVGAGGGTTGGAVTMLHVHRVLAAGFSQLHGAPHSTLPPRDTPVYPNASSRSRSVTARYDGCTGHRWVACANWTERSVGRR